MLAQTFLNTKILFFSDNCLCWLRTAELSWANAAVEEGTPELGWGARLRGKNPAGAPTEAVGLYLPALSLSY